MQKMTRSGIVAKAVAILVLVSLCGAGDLFSAEKETNATITEGRFNGTAWMDMTEVERTVYVVAFWDGLATAADAREEWRLYRPTHTTAGQVAAGLTAIFKEDPANRELSVRMAMRLYTFASSGVPPAEVEAQRIGMLRWIAENSPAKNPK